MADQRTRAIERRAAAGDVEAEARMLVERTRAGSLTRVDLELLAFLRHPAAVAATGGWLPELEIPKKKGWAVAWVRSVGAEYTSRYDIQRCVVEVGITWIDVCELDPKRRYISSIMPISDVDLAKGWANGGPSTQQAKSMVLEKLVPGFRQKMYVRGQLTNADLASCLSLWGRPVVEESARALVLGHLERLTLDRGHPGYGAPEITQTLFKAREYLRSDEAVAALPWAAFELDVRHGGFEQMSVRYSDLLFEENRGMTLLENLVALTRDSETEELAEHRVLAVLLTTALTNILRDSEHQFPVSEVLLPFFSERILDNPTSPTL